MHSMSKSRASQKYSRNLGVSHDSNRQTKEPAASLINEVAGSSLVGPVGFEPTTNQVK